MSSDLDVQQQTFARNPDDRRAFEALEERYFIEGRWEALAQLYRDRIAAPVLSQDPDQLAALLFRLGQILEERILDCEAASEVYWRLAKLDPKNRPALRQLRGIFERKTQWDMVLQIAEIEGQVDMPAYERAVFEAELGVYWHRQMHDPEEASLAFERALAADPELPAALEGLARIHRESGRPSEAAALLERLVVRLRGPERAPVWIQLGTLHTGPLADPARALHCFSQALDDDPYQIAAVEWSLLLETQAESWPAVAELLERRFDLAAGARHRAAIAIEASQIQLNQIGSRPAARAWIERATELDPDEISVLHATADLERADGDAQALLACLERLIRIAGPRTPRRDLFEVAELRMRLGDSEAALDALRLASEKPGGNDLELLSLQARLLRKSGARRELAEVLETLTAFEGFAPASERASALCELARIQEEDLGEDVSARLSWQRAFELEPGEDEALDALERIHRKANDWDALCSLLRTAIEERPAGGDRALLHARLGAVLLDEVGDTPRARSCFEAALAEDPSIRAALAGLRRVAEHLDDPELLLSVCTAERDRGTPDAEELAELARACVPLLLASGRFEAALEWASEWQRADPNHRQPLEWQADCQAELGLCDAEIGSRRALADLQRGRERAATLRRQAALHLQLEDRDAAAAALERALEAVPGELEALAGLAGIYRDLGHAPDLARVLQRWAEAVSEPEQTPILEELARLLQDPIGDLDAAIRARRQLVERPDASRDAQDALEALLELAGRASELVDLLQARRMRLDEDSEEAFSLDRRRARLLLDSLGQCGEAARILTALHEQHPRDPAVINDLERALRAGEDTRGLCDLLEKLAGWESVDERRIAMELERAGLLEEVLDEPLSACDLYESIARAESPAPQAAVALERLERLLESRGEWLRLRTLLEDHLESSADSERTSLHERLAHVCRTHLGDVPGCAAHLEAIVAATPERVDIWQQLEEIYRHELDRPTDWLRVVAAELESGPAPQREILLRVGAARLCLDEQRCPNTHSAEEAVPHYERVLVLDPGHAEATEALVEYHRERQDPGEIARILESRLAHLSTTLDDEHAVHERNTLRLRLAELCTSALDQDSRAIEHYEAVRAELGPGSPIAEPLAALYETSERFEALATLAREVLAARGERSRSPIWHVRLAASERALGHLDAAALAYRSALIDSPDDREIEAALIEIYEAQGELEPLVELLEKRIPYASFEELIDLRLKLAQVHDQGLQAPLEALGHLEALLELNPRHRDAFHAALELAERIGDPERILVLLDRAVAMPFSAVERAGLQERRGRLIAERLGRPDASLPCFQEAIALDPTRETARLALREQLEQLGRWPAVLDCLLTEASRQHAEARLALYERGAEIARTRIDPDAALPWLARLRAETPEDPQIPERIAEIHRRAGRYEAALRAFDDELALRSSAEDRCRVHAVRARLLEEELGAPGRAILAYQAAREAAPSAEARETILAELDRLYETTRRPLERAEILEARVSSLDGPHGLELRRTLASLYSRDLQKPESAIRPLLINVDATRDDPQAQRDSLAMLRTALRASGRHDAWARAVERELELFEEDERLRAATPESERRSLREELARTHDEELGNPERAIHHLLRLTESQTIEDAAGSSRCRERLRALLRRTGRHAELARQLEADLERDGDQTRDWLELAQIREERLHDLPGAIHAYREASRDPEQSPEALRGLRRSTGRLRDWPGLADALEAELEQATGRAPAERAATARKLGEICWQRLGAPARAASSLERALAIEPDSLPALRALIEIREASGEPAAALPLYRRELAILGEGEADSRRAYALWLRLAQGLQSTPVSEDLEPPSTSTPTPPLREALDAYRAAAAIEQLDAADELQMARLHETLGEVEAFCEVFGRWCDRTDSDAGATEHLRLAEQLAAQGRTSAARQRAERATQIDPARPDAWASLARLERDAGCLEAAAEAFARAGEAAGGHQGADLHVEAAACLDKLDADRCHALLSRAIELDPASLDAHVALAHTAARLGHDREAVQEVECALELAGPAGLDDPARLELALLGARAALAGGERDTVRRLFSTALEIDPDHLEALEGVGQIDFESGDYQKARVALERRLERTGENPDLGRHLAMIARGLEAEDLFDAAGSRYEEALEAAPDLEMAHEGLVRIHERSARPDEALRALEGWSESGCDEAARARAALRAGEHALALDDPARAQRNLEKATQLDVGLAPAWRLLCEVVGLSGREVETRRVCETALASIEPGPLSAQIALQAAKLAERTGDPQRAQECYAEATRWEPRCVEAALGASRLARSAGDWIEADGVLARFLDAHPDPTSPTLAPVHFERGRLLSGPLEGLEESIRAYQRALVLQPEHRAARTALASLLLHAPERWSEALALHREILASAPTTASSLRALVRIAEARGRVDLAGSARSVLHALGQASPRDVSEGSLTLPFAIRHAPPMNDRDAERLRRLAHLLQEEIGTILGDIEPPELRPDDAHLTQVIRGIQDVEDEIAAPGLGQLDARERQALFSAIGGLFLDPGGNGGDSRFRESVDRALGIWTRRKVRRIVEETTQDGIENLDYEAWGWELRAMAAAQVVDRSGGELGPVLWALLALEGRAPDASMLEHADLGTLVSSSECARRLLARITTRFCETLARTH